MQSAPKKIALVTGANKGIGFEVARQLAVSGCTVLLGARNPVLGEEAAAKLKRDDVRYLAIDLEDSGTIAIAAQAIDADFGLLDILVNKCRHRRAGGRPAVEQQSRCYRAGLPRKLPGQRCSNSSNASAVAQGSIREYRKCVERAGIAHEEW
jgi:NAD(P)-dependent dehydrogenase (short-subunit alcohol dehydrogenase family)